MKKALAIILLMLVALTAVSCSSKKIAATVNGEPIYMEEVDKQLEQLKQQPQMQQMFEGAEGEKYIKQFQTEILDELIDQKLLIQEAKKQKIKVTEKEINENIEQIKGQFGSEQEFATMLQQANMTMDELKENLENQLLMQKMVEKITKGIEVTDKETEDYYNKNTAEYKEPEKVKIKWIVLSEEKKAKEVLSELKEGADFAEVAKKNSTDATTKDNGGDLGLKSASELPQEVSDVAFKIELNTLSDVIKMSQGFAIIVVEEKQAERQKTYEESKEEIKNQLLSEKQRKAYEDWLEKTKKKAKIEKKI